MLTELKVSQFAIIDSIHINFNNGLNILSGETGAGKSILIKSLALLMGAKSSQQDIRSNKDRAIIEGAFDLSDRADILEKLKDMGVESDEGLLIVRRVLQRTGKSKVYLNGSLSTIADLRRVVSPLVTISNPGEAPLIEITGQHENKDLMSARYQMDVLDQYCGNLKLREQIKAQVNRLRELEERMSDLEEKSHLREQQVDFLEFQISEIQELELNENEDQVLYQQIKDLRQKDQWQAWIEDSLESLDRKDLSALSLINHSLQTAPESKELVSVIDALQNSRTQLEEAVFQLQQLSQNDDEQSGDLEALEDRLSRIRKLQKKFGDSVNQILSALGEMQKEHHELTHLSETLEQLKSQAGELKTSITKDSMKLRKKRLSGAQLLDKEVNKELADLNMKGLSFRITVEPLDELHATGMDKVVFKTQTGKKDLARDLAHAASGGELSRILLSLKQVVGVNQYPRTFLFDEVDTGVSGPTAEKVGAKLKNIANEQQVICVTHLPQVASFADHHYFIKKTPNKDSVEMEVTTLSNKDKINEIARLISGEKVTKTSIAHAKQLLGL